MKIIRSVAQMQKMMMRRAGKSLGFVPTMGALHAGHLSLVRRARTENDLVAVSIFVNPAQFGPREDYQRYPRPFAQDARLCRAAGVDYFFAPAAADMYPDGYATYTEVTHLSNVLCGASRPGHFRGVATVVAKLLNITAPDRAYLGIKDYQQVHIISRMVRDLNMPVKIVACPTVREPSGLALSSRNQFLSAEQKAGSAVIARALHHCRDLILSKKQRKSREIIQCMKRMITSIPGAKIDYVAVVDCQTLDPITVVGSVAAIVCAVRVGTTRLIDNIVVRSAVSR
ncbi:MAG: pantoate--beta-alanine ligase [Elusimicrobia bacterium]|nr:pantoate--beta-alanine ligase [Elusimicrobiota bacterium]